MIHTAALTWLGTTWYRTPAKPSSSDVRLLWWCHFILLLQIQTHRQY